MLTERHTRYITFDDAWREGYRIQLWEHSAQRPIPRIYVMKDDAGYFLSDERLRGYVTTLIYAPDK